MIQGSINQLLGQVGVMSNIVNKNKPISETSKTETPKIESVKSEEVKIPKIDSDNSKDTNVPEVNTTPEKPVDTEPQAPGIEEKKEEPMQKEIGTPKTQTVKKAKKSAQDSLRIEQDRLSASRQLMMRNSPDYERMVW